MTRYIFLPLATPQKHKQVLWSWCLQQLSLKGTDTLETNITLVSTLNLTLFNQLQTFENLNTKNAFSANLKTENIHHYYIFVVVVEKG